MYEKKLFYYRVFNILEKKLLDNEVITLNVKVNMSI